RRVDPASVVPRQRAQQDSYDHHPDRREDGNLERDPRAVEQAQELVVAESTVRAEDVQLRGLGVRCAVLRRNREAAARDMGQRPDRERLHAVAAGVLVEVVGAVTKEMRGNGPAGDRDEDEEDDEDAAADRNLVAAEPSPDLLPVAAGANLFELSELAVRLDCDRRSEASLRTD